MERITSRVGNPRYLDLDLVVPARFMRRFPWRFQVFLQNLQQEGSALIIISPGGVRGHQGKAAQITNKQIKQVKNKEHTRACIPTTTHNTPTPSPQRLFFLFGLLFLFLYLNTFSDTIQILKYAQQCSFDRARTCLRILCMSLYLHVVRTDEKQIWCP